MIKMNSLYAYMSKDVSLKQLLIGKIDDKIISDGSGVSGSDEVVGRISGDLYLESDNGIHVAGDKRRTVDQKHTKMHIGLKLAEKVLLKRLIIW